MSTPHASEAFNPGSTVAVQTTDTLVAAANQGRQEITVTNNGANVVYLRLGTGAAAAATVGIRLNANGGSWTSNVYRGAVRGYADTGATNVLVAEV
jgi:hypothetical protein